MKRILVVDDDKGALTLIGIMLERGGFHVIKAREGNEALSILDDETPDMIILDLMMPLMDGFKLTTLIRQRPATAQTPILILSARSDANSVISSMERGATDYLSKPIMHHDLVAKARQMLNLAPVAE
ncbi:MAG: response regulator [Anaerolineae bacterium]|nr:response regulator [Anaerolineae bacterium]